MHSAVTFEIKQHVMVCVSELH